MNLAPVVLVVTLLDPSGAPTGGYTVPMQDYFACLSTVGQLMEHYKAPPAVNSKMVCMWTSPEAEAAEAEELRRQGILPPLATKP